MSKKYSNSFYVCNYRNCNKFLVEPVVLPCEINVCKFHIDELIERIEGSNKFECYFCDEIHTIPENGFVINQFLKQAIDSKIHLKSRQIQYMEKLNEFVLLITDLKKNKPLNNPETFIYDYFQELRNEIDLHRETLIMKINEMSDKLLEEISDYELKCKINYEQNIKPYETKIDYNDELIENMRNDLSRPFNNEKKYETNFNLIESNLNHLNFQKNALENKLLMGYDVSFKPSFSRQENSIGKILLYKREPIKNEFNHIEILKTFNGHLSTIKHLIADLNLNLVISSSIDRDIKIWSLSDAKCIHTIEKAHDSDISCLVIIDKNTLLTSSSDRYFKVWDLNSFNCLYKMSTQFSIRSICLLPNNKFVSGCKTGILIFWNLDDYKHYKVLKDQATVFCIKLYKKNILITGSFFGYIKMWNIDEYNLKTEFKGHNSKIKYLDIAPNDILVSNSNNFTIKLWNLANNQFLRAVKLKSDIRCIKTNFTQNTLTISTLFDGLVTYDLENNCFNSTINDHSLFDSCFELLSNGQIIIFNCPNHEFKLINIS